MLALAGLVGYVSLSAYNRTCTAKKLISRTNTEGCNAIVVVYKSNWLCPNVETTVIGFNDYYISDSNKNKLVNYALNTNNTTEIIDTLLKHYKSDDFMEATAYSIVTSGNTIKHEDVSLINTERNWVLPAVMPGGYSIIKYKRDPISNELVWSGSSRVWNKGNIIPAK